MIPESLCLACKVEVAAGYKDTRVVAEARRTKRREFDGDWQRELLLGSSQLTTENITEPTGKAPGTWHILAQVPESFLLAENRDGFAGHWFSSQDDTARAAASLAVAQCLQNAEADWSPWLKMESGAVGGRKSVSCEKLPCLARFYPLHWKPWWFCQQVTVDGYRDTSVAAEAKENSEGRDQARGMPFLCAGWYCAGSGSNGCCAVLAKCWGHDRCVAGMAFVWAHLGMVLPPGFHFGQREC